MEKKNRHRSPPKLPLRFFRWFCRPEMVEDIEGDLLERFYSTQDEQGHLKARRRLTWQVMQLMRPGILRSIEFNFILNQTIMLRHNFLISCRMLWRTRGFSTINIVGLALGMAMAMFITLWVQDELKFDKFHGDHDRIFQVMRHVHSGDNIKTADRVTYNIADDIRKNFPEAEKVSVSTVPDDIVLHSKQAPLRESGVYAEPGFFEIFSWELLAGDALHVFDQPTSIVISNSLAKRYFDIKDGEESSIIGLPVRHNVDGVGDLKVTGVFTDIPDQSSLQFDFVIPFENYLKHNDWLLNWNNSGIQIFLRTRGPEQGLSLTSKILNIQNEHIESFRSDLFLQPLSQKHLYATFRDGIQAGGQIEYVRIFILVAVMLLLIACINFMNLSTARAIKRTREIGVRKTIGASRRLLVAQFISGSGVLIFIAFILAFIFFLLGIPLFNGLTGKAANIWDLDLKTIALFLSIGVLTTVTASVYPALYLSSLSAVKVLDGSLQQSGKSSNFRQGLVVFQFMMSTLLMIGTFTVYEQVQFIREKNLGLDRTNVLQVYLEANMRSQYDAVKEELLRSSSVEAVTSGSESPIDIGSSTHSVSWEGKDPARQLSFNTLSVNFDFLEVMKMDLAAGRGFIPDFGRDSANFLINESAQKLLNFEDPIGRDLNLWGRRGTIVGVVKDFNMASFYSEIKPTILFLQPERNGLLFVRTRPGKTQEAILALADVNERMNPKYPLEYTFVDQEYDAMYRSESTVGAISLWFSAFALFIASLGLFGLAIFNAHQRLKEISVRKVLGAGIANLVFLMSREFVILVSIAFVVSAPLAYLLMQRWLLKFSFHTSQKLGIFLIAGMIMVTITIATVGFYSLRVARSNPIDALRAE